MSGYLTIRNNYSDAQSCILMLDTSQNADATGKRVGKTRAGGSLQIDIGRTGTIKLPDFLQEEGDIVPGTDSEPTDQLIERQGAMIQTMQALQNNSLVAADETDAYRINELMTALSNERETTRALGRVQTLVEEEFNKFLETVSEDQLEEVEHRHGRSTEGGLEHRKNTLKTFFRDASISEKVDVYESLKIVIDEEQRKASLNNFAASDAHLDKDARHSQSTDIYRGTDSTTDQHFEKKEEDVSFEELSSMKPLRDESHGYSGGETDAETGTQGDSPDASHKQTQERADQMIESEDTEEEAEENRDEFEGEDDVRKPEDVEEQSNNPEPEQPGGRFPLHQGGGSTHGGKIEDRPVKMSDPDEEGFRANVGKLKVAQLDGVERENNLSGDGNRKERQDAVKEAYDNADDEGKASLVKSVNKALEE